MRDSKVTPWTLLVLAVLVAAGVIIGTRVHRAPAAASQTFGGYASYLPKSTVDGSALHRVVDASVTSPDLATQGDTVRVHATGGSVLATVTGPQVPNEGLPVQSEVSRATWTVTLSGATGRVPLSISQFNVVDGRGGVYHPVLAPHQPALPAFVPSTGSVTFAITDVIAVGEGTLQYVPDNGRKIPVAWDFVVEDD